ncbi:MAG: site-specific integrase [Candidatus Gastranaerophilales bacterium]|nr:site-specific integrase [Candidatus Gastranaerophilales bacterium]
MSEEVTKTLKEWKLKCPIGDMDLVFPNSVGNPMDADNMVKRQFEAVLRKAGIEKIRFHDLRHTYVSQLIAKNAHPKYIQSQVGHTSSQITMDRYGHLTPEVNQQGIDALNSILKEDPSQKTHLKKFGA